MLDENDNKPEFEKLFYNVSVHKNFPINGVVGFVHATDRDVGSNAKVLYSSPTKQGKLRYSNFWTS